jgi:hypothetical protein
METNICTHIKIIIYEAYDEIEVDLFSVSFPYTIIPWKRQYLAHLHESMISPDLKKYGFYNKRRSSIQPKMLRCLMFISTEGHSVTDFDTQSAFNRWFLVIVSQTLSHSVIIYRYLEYDKFT